MMITRKLYDTDSHIREFEARVLACREVQGKGKKTCFAAELDQTAFFAEGGGQAADRGIIQSSRGEELKVLDVQEKDGHILHYLEQPLAEGESIRGILDWEFRFDNMQQHSGEHILSGLCYAWKGYHNVGFHLGTEITTLDFDGPLTEEELKQLEERANRVVYQNQPVTITYPSPEELKQMDYRSKKELTGDVRIVRVGDYDLCACCAPHVMLTGEVGLIKIVRWENYKGGVRLSILCGQRALKDYDEKNRLIYQVAAGMSTKPEKIPSALEKHSREMTELKERVLALGRELIAFKSKQLLTQAKEQGGRAVWVEDLLDPVAARSLINELTPQVEAYAACLIPGKGKGFNLIIASRTRDCRQILSELGESFQVRGGGSPAMVQGSMEGEMKEILAKMPK